MKGEILFCNYVIWGAICNKFAPLFICVIIIQLVKTIPFLHTLSGYVTIPTRIRLNRIP